MVSTVRGFPYRCCKGLSMRVSLTFTIHELTRGPFAYNRVPICQQGALWGQTTCAYSSHSSITVKPYTRHVALLPDIAAPLIESSFLYSLSTRHSYGPWGFSNFLRLKSFHVSRHLGTSYPITPAAVRISQLARLPCSSLVLSMIFVSLSGSAAKAVQAKIWSPAFLCRDVQCGSNNMAT